MRLQTRHIAITLLICSICACSTQKKVRELQSSMASASLSLAREKDFAPDVERGEIVTQRDTFTVKDGERTLVIMNAVKDDNGEMVAHDVLNAAVVSARFRNVAERHGKVDIEFQISVPKKMQDSRWQLRFQPLMYVLEDTLALERVIVTGEDYRKAQLKGYEQYNRFLSSIITDSTKFVNLHLLEIFIERNIPELYAFKIDSTVVSDEEFRSHYGVTEHEAIEHYTNKIAKRLNARRSSRRDKMYRRYVKVPISNEGIRLDTVLTNSEKDFAYDYLETIQTRPKLRKVDVVLQGEIYQEDQKIYDIPATDPLTFYISSLSAFVDNTEKYLTKVIERRGEANTACYIEFAQGSSVVDATLGNNPQEMSRIKGNLESLIQNQEFDIDSIIVTASASPEGSEKFNDKLSLSRSKAISKYFGEWITAYQDSLAIEQGFSVDESGSIIKQESVDIPMLGRSDGENWKMLDALVQEDITLSKKYKESYKSLSSIRNVDSREQAMQKEPYYKYLRESLYPRLRVVRFDFHLHRKGMVKDTVHTTVLDSTYMRGVAAIRERDYKTAITLLRPYNDYNAAVAFCAQGYDASALAILENCEMTDRVLYMLAVLYSRKGDDQKAVEYYLQSCRLNPSYTHRGNLDPEISVLIKRYALNKQDEEEYFE